MKCFHEAAAVEKKTQTPTSKLARLRVPCASAPVRQRRGRWSGVGWGVSFQFQEMCLLPLAGGVSKWARFWSAPASAIWPQDLSGFLAREQIRGGAGCHANRAKQVFYFFIYLFF